MSKILSEKSVQKAKREKLGVKKLKYIRGYIKDLYIYGCYSKADYMAVQEIKDAKYRKDINKIRQLMIDEYYIESGNNKKGIPNLKYNRYRTNTNYLTKAYKISTFTDNDVKIFFSILLILAMEGDEIEMDELKGYVYEAVFENDFSKDTSGEVWKTIDRKINEMSEIGFLEKSKGIGLDDKERPVVNISLAEDFLSAITGQDIDDSHRIKIILSLAQYVLPLSILPNFINDTMSAYDQMSLEEEGDVPEIFMSHEAFHANILNDEVVLSIIEAIEEFRSVEIVIGKNQYEVIPCKIVEDREYGRQYLLCYNITLKRVNTYKLFDIENICKLSCYSEEEYTQKVNETNEIIDHFWSLTQVNEVEYPFDCTKLVKFQAEFKITEKNKYILDRIQTEKRSGVIEKISDEIYLFTIMLYRVEEIKPWIRSFADYVKIRKSNEHNLDEVIAQEWEETKKYYGII